MSTLILLADDHKIMREGLRLLIETQHGYSVIGEADSGRDAIRLAARLKPDLIIMDVRLADMSGIEATRRIKEKQPEIKVLALSMYSDRHYVREMLAAGASGYILKGAAFEELRTGIRVVMEGRTFLSSEVDDGSMRPRQQSQVKELTDRERDVVRLLAQGKSTREAAAELGLSPKTIGSHRSNIMEKLNTKSVAELTRYAIRHGLITLTEEP